MFGIGPIAFAYLSIITVALSFSLRKITSNCGCDRPLLVLFSIFSAGTRIYEFSHAFFDSDY